MDQIENYVNSSQCLRLRPELDPYEREVHHGLRLGVQEGVQGVPGVVQGEAGGEGLQPEGVAQDPQGAVADVVVEAQVGQAGPLPGGKRRVRCNFLCKVEVFSVTLCSTVNF